MMFFKTSVIIHCYRAEVKLTANRGEMKVLQNQTDYLLQVLLRHKERIPRDMNPSEEECRRRTHTDICRVCRSTIFISAPRKFILCAGYSLIGLEVRLLVVSGSVVIMS